MTSQYRHRRSSIPATTFTALEPGEIAVNTANRQLSVGDANSATIGAALPLLAIRVFDARAMYVANDYVVNDGILYRAKFATGPNPFDILAWDVIAGQQSGAFVLRTGDTMSGHLSLPPGPGSAQAVRKDYVDNALQPYATLSYVNLAITPLATTNYVDTQDAKALPKAGGTMTGALTLSGDPTSNLHAATKTYVDSKIVATPGIPAGMIMDFAGPNAPAGWFPCDGWELNRADYPALFAAIGTTWGAGNGATTFNIPSLQTRYRRHRDNSPNYANTVGTLQNPCNLSHYHGVNINSGYVSADHAHYTSGTTGAADRSLDHLHGGIPTVSSITSGGFINSAGLNYVNYNDRMTGYGTDRSIDHLHGWGGWSGGANANHYHNLSGNTGGGSADGTYEARPYSATVLTCIKT